LDSANQRSTRAGTCGRIGGPVGGLECLGLGGALVEHRRDERVARLELTTVGLACCAIASAGRRRAVVARRDLCRRNCRGPSRPAAHSPLRARWPLDVVAFDDQRLCGLTSVETAPIQTRLFLPALARRIDVARDDVDDVDRRVEVPGRGRTAKRKGNSRVGTTADRVSDDPPHC
jgi:hypothetical protein